ncbi:MAG: phage holin family protein [Nitrosomonadaceae bacterium]|nr:phage holin family protein [Nitrosomonadaceae bacterium]
MAEKDPASEGGLIESIRKLAITLVGVLQTRLQIFSTELEEAKLQLGQLLLLGLVTVFCLGLGVVLLTVFFVVLFWDSYRLPVLGVMSGLFLVLGIFAALALRAKSAENTRMFSSTLAELSKDREQLKNNL